MNPAVARAVLGPCRGDHGRLVATRRQAVDAEGHRVAARDAGLAQRLDRGAQRAALAGLGSWPALALGPAAGTHPDDVDPQRRGAREDELEMRALLGLELRGLEADALKRQRGRRRTRAGVGVPAGGGVGVGAPTIAVWATVTVAEMGVLRVVSVAVMTVVPTALEAVTVAV